MTISERIFERLAQMHMTQKQFSEETGILQSTISEWKKKKTNPTSEKIMVICICVSLSNILSLIVIFLPPSVIAVSEVQPSSVFPIMNCIHLHELYTILNYCQVINPVLFSAVLLLFSTVPCRVLLCPAVFYCTLKCFGMLRKGVNCNNDFFQVFT